MIAHRPSPIMLRGGQKADRLGSRLRGNVVLLSRHQQNNAMSSSGFQSLSRPIDPRSLSFSLAFVYLALCVVCSVILGRVLFFRHRLLSFGPVFIMLAFFWTLVRSVQLFLAKARLSRVA